MLQVINENEEINLRFSKNLTDLGEFSKFLSRLKIEDIATRSRMTEEQAIEIANDIKADYWEANKDFILSKVKK